MDAINPAQPLGLSPDSSSTHERGGAPFDEAYRFGRRPNVKAPFPFTDRQFGRLLVLRGRVQDSPSCEDQRAA